MPYEEFKRYLDVSAYQIDTDWFLTGDNFQNETRFEMRPCTIKDFGNTTVTDKYFYSWNGFITLCPELKNKDGKQITFNGAWGMNQTSAMQFRIDKCDGKVNECESDEKIKGFLRDIKF